MSDRDEAGELGSRQLVPSPAPTPDTVSPDPLASSANAQPAKQLPEGSWSGDQELLQLWLATPASVRQPQTQAELARKLNHHESTLSKWKSLPGWADAVLALKRVLIRSEDVAQVLDALVQKALTGDVPAAKVILEYAGILAADAGGPDTPYQQMTLKIDGEEIVVQLRQRQQGGSA